MKFVFFLGSAIALVAVIDPAIGQTPAEIKSIAQAVTIEITLDRAKSSGSGIIIHNRGDIYTAVTNRHVVCGATRSCARSSATETLRLKFADGSSLDVSSQAVKIFSGDLDLATIQFRSSNPRQIAKISPANSIKAGDRVYTSGYPARPQGFSFNSGKAIAVVDRRLQEDRGGYTIVYDAATQPGMSGGGVFDRSGNLVAIHGQGERHRDNTQLQEVSATGQKYITQVGNKIGYNRGIPIDWVVRNMAAQNAQPGGRASASPTTTNTADEHFIAGFNKFVEPGSDVKAGKQQAIRSFSLAIERNSGYVYAYSMRAYIYFQLRQDRLALADYNRAIALDSGQANVYHNRATLKQDRLEDFAGALADYNRAIDLNPQLVLAYLGRGNLKKNNFNDVPGALADYNRVLSIDAQFAPAYYNRGNLYKDKLKDVRAALHDYSRALEIDDRLINAYINRGLLKQHALQDPQGALADFNRAIDIDSKLAIAYSNRGVLKHYSLNDPQGALTDLDRAISIEPKFTNAYLARGYLKYTKLQDRPGGIADTIAAAKFAKLQGDFQAGLTALQTLKSWGVNPIAK